MSKVKLFQAVTADTVTDETMSKVKLFQAVTAVSGTKKFRISLTISFDYVKHVSFSTVSCIEME